MLRHRCREYHGDIASEALMSAAAAFEAFLQDEDALQERCPVEGRGLDGVPRRLIDMASDEVDKCRHATPPANFFPLKNLPTFQSIINVTWEANQENLASYGAPKQGSYCIWFSLKATARLRESCRHAQQEQNSPNLAEAF